MAVSLFVVQTTREIYRLSAEKNNFSTLLCRLRLKSGKKGAFQS
jgi:hypothetical protein